jgi:hypothetical protein
MPNKRKEGKKLVGFFATEEEAAALLSAAKAGGMTVADFIRTAIHKANAKHTPKVKPSAARKK